MKNFFHSTLLCCTVFCSQTIYSIKVDTTFLGMCGLLIFVPKIQAVCEDLFESYQQYCVDSQLHNAVHMMDLQAINKAFDNGANVNALDAIETNLEKVVLWEYVPAIKLLLGRGATMDKFSFEYLKRRKIFDEVKYLIPENVINQLETIIK